MERPGDHEPARPEPEVGLADAAVAAEIARAAARGRGSDRTPTLEQLLAAFGEHEPSERARQRVAAALQLAGMGVRPGLDEAQPGQRLVLLPPGGAGAQRGGRAALGLAAVAVVLVAAAGAAALVGGGGGDRAGDSLPATSTTRFTPPSDPTPASGPAATTRTTSTATVPGGATTTGTTATSHTTATATTTTGSTTATGTTTTGTTTTGTTASGDDAARRHRHAHQRHKAAAGHRRTVKVVVDASAAPSFVCADDGHGHQLYAGTLTGAVTFRQPEVRLNVGLASTVVTVDGHAVPLSGSPAGLDVSRGGGVQTLPLGQRPCA